MTIQSNLNNQALIQLPKIWEALNNAKNPAYSNIYNYALNVIMNSAISLDLMSDADKAQFDMSLYAVCHSKVYLNSQVVTMDEALDMFPSGSFDRADDYYKDMDTAG